MNNECASTIYAPLGKWFYQLVTGGDTERLHACMGSPVYDEKAEPHEYILSRRAPCHTDTACIVMYIANYQAMKCTPCTLVYSTTSLELWSYMMPYMER